MRAVAAVAVLMALAVTTAGAAAESVHEHSRFRALGTAIDVRVHADTAAIAQRAADRSRAVFERIHRQWYPWRADTTLARINRRLAAGERAQAPPALIRLLRRARRLEAASGGRFNPAIGGLVELWGFHEPPPYEDPPPEPAALRRWAEARPSTRDLRLGRDHIASDNPAVQLDLGAIGKGAAVDRARRRMRNAGAATALINAGGDLAALGERNDRPWRVGLRDPGGGVLAELALRADEAVFTSGDYARYRETPDGERLGHVLDPRTGSPARGAVQATAIAATGARADAAATALLVAGAEAWWRVARAMRLRHALVIAADGTVYVNRALARRLRFRGGEPSDLVVRALY